VGEKSEETCKLQGHIWSVLGTALGFELNSKYNVLKYQTRPHSGNFSCISRYLFALAVSSGWSLDHPLHKRRFTKCKLQEQDSIPYRTVLLQKPNFLSSSRNSHSIHGPESLFPYSKSPVTSIYHKPYQINRHNVCL